MRVPWGTREQIVARDVHVVALHVELVLALHVRVEDLARDGTRPGCATHVPSWPFVTSRSLSARTFASASSFFAASSLIGICAAMPPIAWTPRRWHVLMRSCT